MPVNAENYRIIITELEGKADLVAVSKLKSVEEIKVLYDLGQRDFGENYVQELLDKQPKLPGDVRWHFIGHLQSNKVKYIAPFIHLIHGVDSVNLLKEINKQAKKTGRNINALLQVHIAVEQTKFGLDEAELQTIMETADQFTNVNILGLMGMASFSDNQEQVRSEFRHLNNLFTKYKSSVSGADLKILSMGMSGDYRIALEEGSNMVRIGSLLFGPRINQG